MADAPDLQPLSPDSTLIIGAGVAGLFTALKMAPRPVTIITASPLGKGSSSFWAQGGVAAAMGSDDNAALHYQDTIKAGAGLVDEPAAHILTQEGPGRVNDLIDLGIKFDRSDDGRLKLGKEAAHSRHRIIHATGDKAGATIMAGLIAAARKADHITIQERIVVEELIVTEDDTVYGVLAYDITAERRVLISCPRTVLATGGVGGLYAVTTNPVRAQGHGIAMAFRAGAEIMDPEFVQFHPTALDVGIDPAPLATEALRGEGAKLVDRHGAHMMAGVHPDADLAPRDIVARTVASSIANGNGAFLDARMAIGASFPEAFPTVYAACMKSGIDPITQTIPIAPAAHYHMGGVRTDEDGRTTRPGLWAIGEVANTGIHGANRLASNSLLEALVFGARAACDLTVDGRGEPDKQIGFPSARLDLPPLPATPGEMMALRRLMADNAGLIRSRASLGEALQFVHDCMHAVDVTSGFHNALMTSSLILGGANNRLESRGSHTRTDYPDMHKPSHGIMWLDHSAQKARYRIDPIKRISTTRGAA